MSKRLFIAKALNGKSSDYKPYIVRRAFRIIPIYLLAMFLAALLFNERMSVRMEMPWNTPGQLAAVENYWSTISDNVAAYLMPCLMLLQGLIRTRSCPMQEMPFSASVEPDTGVAVLSDCAVVSGGFC